MQHLDSRCGFAIGSQHLWCCFGAGRKTRLESSIKKLKPPFDACLLFSIVLDEAHFIKNRHALTNRACCGISAERRWVLSGTPIQNRLEDLYGLLKFLRFEPWSVYSHWKTNIEDVYAEEPTVGMQQLQNVLRPIMLRRTKDTVDKNGKKICTLPSSSVAVQHVDLGPAERDFYDAIFSRSKTQFSEYIAAGNILSNYANILVLLLRLRQSCDHPLLTLQKEKKQKEQDAHTFADIDSLINKFIKDSGTDNGGLNASFASSVATKLKDTYANDGSGSKGDSKEGATSPTDEELECPICLDQPLEPVILPCAHIGCSECFTSVIRRVHYCPICRKEMSVQDIIPVPLPKPKAVAASTGGSKPGKVQRSAKLDALVDEMKNMLQESPDNKCIVFSQFIGMLDLVDAVLGHNKIPSLRLDGSLSQQQRVNILDQFRKDKKITCLTMSLRAGGVGLNLTAASHVYLLDPWWNPAVEEQAIDRVHRIGQKKKVTVRRLIARETIEERILQLQERKRSLASAVMSKTVDRRQERIADLKLLFEFNTKK